MKLEALKRSHLKRNIIIGLLLLTMMIAFIIQFTRAKYRVTQSIPLVKGTINYSLADLNIVAITVDGEQSDTIPSGNYELSEESFCTLDGEKNNNIKLSYDMESKTLIVSPMFIKGTKCYLDFKKVLFATDVIISQEGKEQENGKLVLENGYRYQGSSPDNYIYFNCDDYDNQNENTCELWRIIGVFDQDINGKTEKLLKIINYEKQYANYTWSSNDSNIWTDSTLQVELNTDYLNRKGIYASSGIKDTTRNIIEDAKWVLGESNEGQTAHEAYLSELNTNNNWIGKIGLISLSDYAYAALESDCPRTTHLQDYNLCSNWILTNEYMELEWLISPNDVFSPDGVSSILDDGSVRGFAAVYSGYNSHYYRPTIYLKPNIIIKDGNGTYSNPYQLSFS